MDVQLIDYMGNDLLVANAARVSFSKETDFITEPEEGAVLVSPAISEDDHNVYVKHADVRLINYLAKHNHWTPFGHPHVCLRIQAPFFVARQLGRHTVGAVWNEESRRYVDHDPSVFKPTEWRIQSEDKKQGSSDENLVGGQAAYANDLYHELVEHSEKVYHELCRLGVAREMARATLLMAHETQWYWTGSLAFFSRVAALRLKPDAQKETADVVQKIADIIRPLFPVSWQALEDSVKKVA